MSAYFKAVILACKIRVVPYKNDEYKQTKNKNM